MLKALLESKENNLSAIIKRIGAEPFQLQANVDAEIPVSYTHLDVYKRQVHDLLKAAESVVVS